jgi:hypothetical protein
MYNKKQVRQNYVYIIEASISNTKHVQAIRKVEASGRNCVSSKHTWLKHILLAFEAKLLYDESITQWQ